MSNPCLRTSRIVGWGSYLPEKIVSNEDLSKTLDTSHEWIVERTGISQRHVAAPGELTSDLATYAARQALDRAGLSVDQVDALIVATASPDYTFPSTAVYVQAKLGMNRGFAFDVSAVCAGFVYALSVGHSMIVSGQAETVVVVGAETFSRLLDWSDRRTAILFGDGAGAVVLKAHENASEGEPLGIFDIDLCSDGNLSDILKMTGGPSATQTLGHMEMDGKEVFKNAVSKLVDVGERMLSRNELQANQVKWIIPHQANRRIIEAVGKRLGLSEEQTVITVDRHANTSAASIPLALATMADRIQEGDMVFLQGLGAGLTWGGILLRW